MWTDNVQFNKQLKIENLNFPIRWNFSSKIKLSERSLSTFYDEVYESIYFLCLDLDISIYMVQMWNYIKSFPYLNSAVDEYE